jgi:2,4-dienoyl-CoA reductase-like NADH-dependent reductase (Old Yellow Enzyme family)
MDSIFTPLRINRAHELKNRLVVAPMTTSQSHPDGTISTEEADWLERLAADGYGMVISCAAAISHDSIAFENQLSLGEDRMMPGLEDLAKRMKKHGGISIIQLCHAGSRAIKAQPFSASSYSLPSVPGFVPPGTLTKQQIGQIAEDFAAACVRAEKAGFDGIEFHGANGYLFTQFISRMTNLRTDEYGGSLENRARFSRQVVQSCRNAVSRDFIIGFRLSFENAGLETGLDIDENIRIADWLAEDGIDYIHVSQLDCNVNSVKYPGRVALAYICSERKAAIPLLAAGGITSRAKAAQALDHGAHCVAIGRAAIGNTEVPKQFAETGELLHQTPFSEAMLTGLGISRDFIAYLHKQPVASMNVVE